MTTILEVPTNPRSETFLITLAGVQYKITLRWVNTIETGWLMDVAKGDGTPLVNGIAVVSGIDLLGQYPQYNFGGKLGVFVSGDPTGVPTYETLGNEGKLYFIAEE